MTKKENFLRDKLEALENLTICEAEDARIFKQKLEALKDIALLLVEELEALESVRSVNISRGISLPEEMRAFEIHLIQSALERTGGHQTRAAQLLGINLTTLHNKLKRLGISAEEIVNAPILHEDVNFSDKTPEENLSRFHSRKVSRLAA